MVERRGEAGGYRIRVRLSALINFLVNIYRTIASFIFTVVVIRRLDPHEYGLYATLLSTANAVASPIAVWIYWGSRRHVLGVRGSIQGALALGGIYSVLSTPLFILVSSLFTSGTFIYAVLSILILAFYILLAPLNIVVSLLLLYAPDKGGLLGIVFESVRVALAYLLVVVFGAGVFGAVIGPGIASAVTLAYAASLLARMGILNLGSRSFRMRVEGLGEAVRLLKLSTLSIPNMVTGALGSLDKAIMGIISSSTIPAAYASISSVPKAFISPGAFTAGLYAKTLREPREEDIVDILIIYSFISIFLTSMLITLSVPAVSLFNPAYIDGAILFIMASLEALILGYASIFETIAIGAERADVKSKDLLGIAGTPLGRVPLAQMTRFLVCIASASLTQLALWSIGVKDPVTLVMPYSAAYLLSSIPYTLYIYRLAIAKVSFKMPWKDMAAFTLASLVASSAPIMLGLGEIVVRSFWKDLALLLPGAMLSALIYALSSLSTSNRMRILFIEAVKRLFR